MGGGFTCADCSLVSQVVDLAMGNRRSEARLGEGVLGKPRLYGRVPEGRSGSAGAVGMAFMAPALEQSRAQATWGCVGGQPGPGFLAASHPGQGHLPVPRRPCGCSMGFSLLTGLRPIV